MSISSINQSNVLGEDVLLMIFEHLEGEDLVKCEAVCRQWRDILLIGTPWRRLFHRKIKCSSFWRRAQKKLEKNQVTMRTDQYRDVCRKIQVEANWRIVQCEQSVYSVDANAWDITISDDYVAWSFSDYKTGKIREGCSFLNTESLEITEIPSTWGDQVLDEMLVRWADRTSSAVEVRDPKNLWIVNLTEENGKRRTENVDRQISFGSGRLVEYTRPYNLFGTERIRVWKMGDPPTLIHDRTFEDRDLKIWKVDEQFIVAKRTNRFLGAAVYFISTATLEVFKSLYLNGSKWIYDRGLLYQYRGDGIVQISDVASGTHFNDVHLPIEEKDKPFVELMTKWASSNSTVMVFGWNRSKILSRLSVYDLEEVKKPNSDSDCHLLYTLQIGFYISSFAMDETRIACTGLRGKFYVTVLNFDSYSIAKRKPFALKENPKDDEYIRIGIIYNRSKSNPRC